MKIKLKLFQLFCWLLLIPVIAAGGEVDLEEEVQSALFSSRQLVMTMTAKLRAGGTVDKERAALQALAESVRVVHLLLLERFRDVGEQPLAGDFATRQQRMAERYQKEVAAYLNFVKTLPLADRIESADLLSLQALLDRILPPVKQPLFGSLPYRHQRFPARKPSMSPLVVPAYQGGNPAINLIDTQSDLTVIPPEIANLAKSLDWSPVLIYQWVLANIDSEWYWGSMKSATETLRQRSGNDADQAALLVALLRASNYPARYVRGVIEFAPGIERLQNLLGLNDPQQTIRFLQQAGIPAEPVIAGGKVSNVRIEHVWVETYVPYANYRGAVLDEQGKIWLPLDTHLKPNGYLDTPPATALPAGFLDGLPAAYLAAPRAETPLEYLHQRFTLEKSSPWTNALWQRTLQTVPLDLLPMDLQFRTLAVTAEAASVPVDLIHTVTFRAASEDGSELFNLTLPTAQLSNHQVVLGCVPETVADQNLIDSHGGLSNTPAYLVRLRPTLQVDGERLVVARDGLEMGGDYQLTVQFNGPAGQEAHTSRHIVGNLAVLGIVAQQALLPPALPQEEQNAAWLLQGTALRYIDRWNAAEEELAAALHLAIARPLPTLVTVGCVLEVSRLLDTPRELTWKGLFMDAGLRRIEVVAQAGQAESVADFMRLSALQGSVLEQRIFEEDYQVAAISTATVLALAASAGNPPLVLDGDNLSELLPTLAVPDNIRADIAAAVRQGLTVTLPAEVTTLRQWSGYGYRKEDARTGEAGYMLSGTIAGGMTAEEWAESYRKHILLALFGLPPNNDPLAAAHIAKIPVNDRESGVVGQQFPKPLAVLVTDIKGRPVVGAEVTFSVLAGGGTFDKPEDQTVATDFQGIARVRPVLGQKTGDNPSFQRVNVDDTYATQVGVNLLSASVASRYGDLAIAQPFEIYGRPQPPNHLIKQVGDGNSAIVNNPMGSIAVQVVDLFENPVSNVPVTFNVLQAESIYAQDFPDIKLPNGYRNLELYGAGECSGVYPLWGDCPSSSTLTVKSTYHGAMVNTFAGDSLATRYKVQASVADLEPQIFKLSSLGWKTAGDYLPPQIYIRYLTKINAQGKVIDAAKAGAQLPDALQVGMFMTYSEVSLAGPRKCIRYVSEEVQETYDCWDMVGGDLVRTRRITDGRVNFTPIAGGGNVSATENVGEGIYQAAYTTGVIPALNVLEAVAEAEVEVPIVTGWTDRISLVTYNRATMLTGLESPHIPVKTVTLKSGQRALFDSNKALLDTPVTPIFYSVYGVDVPTLVTPEVILLGDGGMTRQNVTVDYTIQPQGEGTAGYTAQSADLDLYSGACTSRTNDQWVGYLLGSAKAGVGNAVFSQGAEFDPQKSYCVQAVLNRGTAAEIRGDKVKLNMLYADLDIDSDNNAGALEDGTHNLPNRDPLEDQAEELVGYPGKVIRPNLFDPDGDQIPGFADGLRKGGANLFDNRENSDGTPDSVPFVPVQIELAGSALDPAAATVSFDYLGSDPAQVQKSTVDGKDLYTPAPGGGLRLWSKDGKASRKVEELKDGGDYLKPGEPYRLSALGNPSTPGVWNFYIEGIAPSLTAGDRWIAMKIDPDGNGPLPALTGDAVRSSVILAALVPDYDHNRVIDDKDKALAALGDTFYFWINDDDDEGEVEGSDIPGQANGLFPVLDYDSPHIDGVRDLIDFFPVVFDVKSLTEYFPPATHRYRLKSSAESVKVAFPQLTQDHVGDYLTVVETARGLAQLDTYKVMPNGVFWINIGFEQSDTTQTNPAQEKFDQLIRTAEGNENAPVLLVEGRKESNVPLTLEVLDVQDRSVFTLDLKLSIAGVEQMFRHVNLVSTVNEELEVETGMIGEHEAVGGEASRYGSDNFANKKHFSGVDAEVNEHYFVQLHGANVDGQGARGWHSEMFKRLYWSGSRAKFVGVSWYGSKGIATGYQPNVSNAFKTAAQFGQEIAKATNGKPVTIMAHSLGNMVVSSYLNDHYQQNPLNVVDYFLFNAAVALEAYLGDYNNYAEGELTDSSMSQFGSDNPMVHSSWFGYDKRLGSSEWHQLFEPNDPRRKLTWRNRFANLPLNINYYNFYSTGEDVLATHFGDGIDFQFPDVWNSDLGRFAWVLQEKWKGRGPGLGSTDLMGWEFNQNSYRTTETVVEGGQSKTSPWEPGVANNLIRNEQLLSEPFFRKPGAGQLGNQLFGTMVDAAYVNSVRNELLALALPSLTLVTGGWLGEDIKARFGLEYFVNMNDPLKKNGWPISRENNNWLHSDIKAVSYVFDKYIFDSIVNRGGLK